MESEIKAIIEKNLPAQVGDVLKSRLEAAEMDAKEVLMLRDALVQANKSFTELTLKMEEYKKLDERNSKLDEKEEILYAVDRNLKIQQLEIQLVAEKDKCEFAKNIALGLVRNSEFRKSIFDNESRPSYMGTNGQMVYPTNVSKNLTETNIID